MKFKKNDNIAWVFGGLYILSLIVMMFNTIVGILLMILFLAGFVLFAEPEIKKEREILEEKIAKVDEEIKEIDTKIEELENEEGEETL